ncbi:MAG: phage holin, LLH family [Negativibacillus sp.]|nr:phage holin, LLH family [Negativibacillus sp.]
MELDLTQIVVALIGLMGLVITSVIVPLIKSKITSSQWDTILSYAIAGVQAAEIIFNAQGQGEAKLRWVSEYITNQCLTHGIKIDAETVRVAIENAWNQLGLNRKQE